MCSALTSRSKCSICSWTRTKISGIVISNTRDFKNYTIFIINKTKLINNNTLSYSKIIYSNFLFPQPLEQINGTGSAFIISNMFGNGFGDGVVFNITGPAENTITVITQNISGFVNYYTANFSAGPGVNRTFATGG